MNTVTNLLHRASVRNPEVLILVLCVCVCTEMLVAGVCRGWGKQDIIRDVHSETILEHFTAMYVLCSVFVLGSSI